MSNYKVNTKNALALWSKKYPAMKMNLTVLSEKTGISQQNISQLNSRYKEIIQVHAKVLFLDDDKERIKEVWALYSKLEQPLFVILEAIRVFLECEIWDLITEVESENPSK